MRSRVARYGHAIADDESGAGRVRPTLLPLSGYSCHRCLRLSVLFINHWGAQSGGDDKGVDDESALDQSCGGGTRLKFSDRRTLALRNNVAISRTASPF